MALSAGARHRHEGRPRAHGTRPVAAQRPPGAPAPRLRGQPAAAQARPHRPLPAAPPRSRGAIRGVRSARSRSSRTRARSSTSASPTSDLRQLDVARGIVDVATVQNRFGLTDRHSDDVLAVCERDGIGFLPWAPLGERHAGKRQGRRRDRRPPRHDPDRGGDRLAAAPLAGDDADSRHIARSRTSRRTSPRRRWSSATTRSRASTRSAASCARSGTSSSRPGRCAGSACAGRA